LAKYGLPFLGLGEQVLRDFDWPYVSRATIAAERGGVDYRVHSGDLLWRWDDSCDNVCGFETFYPVSYLTRI